MWAMRFKSYLYAVGIILTGFCYSSCKKLDEVQDKVEDVALGDIEKVEGTWTLNSVRYVYEETVNDIWTTFTDTLYPDASGILTITAVNEDDIEGSYDFTFNDTSSVREVTGDFSSIAPTVYTLRFKSNQEHDLFDAGVFLDLLIEENTETSLKLNRKQLIPKTSFSPGVRENWYLVFTK